MEAVAVHLKWHQTFLFLFQTVLFVADTTTDILTSVHYKEQGHTQWFAVSFGLTIMTMVVLCIWSIMVSRSRLLAEEEDSVGADNPEVILKERLYNFYVQTLILGLLEAAPHLIIQCYVMLKERDDDVSLIQKISVSISGITLTWIITSMEVFRQFEDYNLKLVPRLVRKLIIFLSNTVIIAARVIAIVCFLIAFSWWFFLVFGVHCFIINLTGFLLWRSNRKQDMLVFIFAYSPFYLFSYSSYYLKKLRGDAPFSLACRVAVKVSWYVLFTLENVGMILGSSSNWPHVSDSDWFYWFLLFPGYTVVFPGNLGGMLFKLLSWYCYCGCFHSCNCKEDHDDDEYWANIQRAHTLGVTTGLTMNRV